MSAQARSRAETAYVSALFRADQHIPQNNQLHGKTRALRIEPTEFAPITE
jgi:hypothetical protein